MTQYDPHSGSPFAQGARNTSPKEVMFRLRQDNPTSSKSDLIKIFKDEARNDPELDDVCVEIAAINAYEAWERLQPSNPCPSKQKETPQQKTTRQQNIKQRAAEIAEKITKACILDFIMPNDKALRDCTFREVGKFNNGFAKIAKAGKPNQKIGDVLSPEKANALMR
jgi:hypothetical protein